MQIKHYFNAEKNYIPSHLFLNKFNQTISFCLKNSLEKFEQHQTYLAKFCKILIYHSIIFNTLEIFLIHILV